MSDYEILGLVCVIISLTLRAIDLGCKIGSKIRRKK